MLRVIAASDAVVILEKPSAIGAHEDAAERLIAQLEGFPSQRHSASKVIYVSSRKRHNVRILKRRSLPQPYRVADAVGGLLSARSSLVPSTSTLGRIRSSQRGSHHARSPSRLSTAGVRVMRTRKASMSTPRARPKPMGRIIASSANTNPPNTDTMMIAAAVTTRALWLKPVSTA